MSAEPIFERLAAERLALIDPPTDAFPEVPMPSPSRPALVPALVTLRDQLNRRYPRRSKASDGWIGDPAHAARASDHNPDGNGWVHAVDLTHDPAQGVDIDRLTDELQASRDPRISYVIANNWIMSGPLGPDPWRWRRYTGSNPHTKHMHISARPGMAYAIDARPWSLASFR